MAQPPTLPTMPTKKFQCFACGNIIEVPRGMPKPPACSKCGAPTAMIHRIDKGQPSVRGAGRRGRGPRWSQ